LNYTVLIEYVRGYQKWGIDVWFGIAMIMLDALWDVLDFMWGDWVLRTSSKMSKKKKNSVVVTLLVWHQTIWGELLGDKGELRKSLDRQRLAARRVLPGHSGQSRGHWKVWRLAACGGYQAVWSAISPSNAGIAPGDFMCKVRLRWGILHNV